MTIEIIYKLKDSESTNVIVLTPEQYFDSIIEGENYENDSIAQFGDTIDYIKRVEISITENDLDNSILKIQGSIRSDSTLRTTYYGNETEFRYFVDYEGRELIVQSIRIAENCMVINRMERDNINSEWTNISYSTGLNYKNESHGREIWYSATKVEYIKRNLIND
ncbi:MAG: hypothetical protein Q8M15_01150 [Bacteroidota bacterium]|nr:hypothetical protein [Bacteroidota bacterium]